MGPLNAIAVPAFARIDEYAGAWAIEPTAGRALWRHAERLDAAHFDEAKRTTQAARGPDSTIERVPAADGKSVAIIRLQGMLMKQQSSLGASTSTIQARRDIRAAAADPNIQAILVAIDSPGGTAAGTEALANDIRDAGKAKPVYAQVEDLGASAAYYAASQAQKIFASTRSTQVGSIGTLLVVSDQSAAADKEGVKVHVFATGPVKGAGMPGTALTDEHKKYFQDSVEALQIPFDDAVKSGRKLSDAQLAAVKTGGVFTAEESLRLGLVDGIQSIDATLAQLIGRPGGKSSSNYQAAAGGKGASAMTFEQYCQARALDATSLNDAQRAALQADFEASQKTAPVATPILRNGDGASLMGDIERYNANAIRVAELQSVCQELGNPRVEYLGATQTAYQHAVKHGLSVDDTRRLCALGNMRNERPIHSGVATRVPDADREQVMQAAIEQAAKVQGLETRYTDRILQAAHTQYKGRIGLKRMILEAAFANGYQGNIDSLAEDHKGVLQAAFSTLSLPGILSNVANKLLLEGFMFVESTWRMISKIRPVTDFKTVTSYRMTGDDTFVKVGPAGDLKHATASEESFTNSADTYGIMFSVTRRDQINDDLGAITDKPRRIGRGAGLKLNDVFWAAFCANSAFFVDPSQDYYKGADAVLASAGLSKVLAKFRKKVDADSKPLNIQPKILLVPAALEVTGLELFKSTNYNTGGSSTTDKVPSSNIWANRFQLAVSSYLDNASYGNSAIIWYLLADPMDIPVIETCFLNGSENPIVESSDADFGTLGIEMRGYFDFGVSKQDSRGGVMSKGAA